MKKEKDRQNLDYKELFTKPWCPLFGHLPFSENCSHSVRDCLAIIEDARAIWGIPPGLYRKSSYPEPTEVNEWIEEGYLITARLLFIHAFEIYYKASTHHGYYGHLIPNKEWIKTEFEIHMHRGLDEISWQAMYAIIAIFFTRDALRMIFNENKSDDDPEVILTKLIANNLFKEIEKLDLEFPAEHGYKFLNSCKKTRKDNLQKIIEDTYLKLKKKKIKLTGKEVFDALPINKCIQEKEEDNNTIYWITSRGKERKTSFKKFLDRLTKIKKSRL